ncbi:hypothetical protein H0H93_011776 [Arthromyces matolae]|nr:hypothetical protein H0H93_011776 [Arthromyces matolae]
MTENVPKGPQDRPLEDVVIVKSGELPLDEEITTTAEIPVATEAEDVALPTAVPEVASAYLFIGKVLVGVIVVIALGTLLVQLGVVRYARRWLPGGDIAYRKLRNEDA